MYAIIRSGGKQYRVEPGDTLRVEKTEHQLGSSFEIADVLFLGNGEEVLIGSPTVSGASVGVTVTQHAKSPKILVFKKKRRKGYRRLKGHRQPFTELFVSYIKSPIGSDQAQTQAVVIDPVKKAAKKAEMVNKMDMAGKSPVAKKPRKKISKKTAPRKSIKKRVKKASKKGKKTASKAKTRKK